MADNTPGTQGSQNNPPRQSGLSWSQPASTARPSQTGAPATSSSSSPPKFISSPVRPVAQAQPSSRRGMLLFTSGVVAGGLLAWSWFSLSPATITVSEGTGAPTGGTAATGGEAAPTTGAGAAEGIALPGSTIGSESLVIPSPQDAGLSVQITSAAVSAPTWVVVYESRNSVRGNALGAALFFPQDGAKSVKLLRATMPNQTYFVGRHVDNGDKQ